MSSMPKSSPNKINTAAASAAPYVAGANGAAKAASASATHHVHDANCGCGSSGSAAYSTQASPKSPVKPAVPGSFNTLPELLKANKTWAANMVKLDPNFFANLANQQSPQLLWIGCSDSRVPANQIINLAPGEVFVHRNIANVVNHGDLNALSVLQYAVDVLKVKHVIVTGHYGCGGVAASMTNQQFGLIDNWLRTIKDVYQANEAKLDALKDPKAKLDLMVELNVANSVRNVCATTIVQNAWKRGQELSVHGWCYRLEDGVIRDLDICISQPEQISRIYNVMSGKTVANA